jgi:hypothetical protein
MNAQQQMRWTPRGAHLMLKVRCAVMNGMVRSSAITPSPNKGSGVRFGVRHDPQV